MCNERYRAVLCDLDGCLVSGASALPGAVEFGREVGERLYIVSNNSTDTPATLSRRLSTMGIVVPEARIILAGAVAVERIALQTPGARVAIYGSDPIKRHAQGLGLLIDGDAPDVILLTRDSSFSYASLQTIVHQCARGTRLVVSNLDDSHPGVDGSPVPETGALLKAVMACLPQLRYEAVGKPSGVLFEAALTKAGVKADHALFIGDNPETDGAGAVAIGLPFRLVTPGALTVDILYRTSAEAHDWGPMGNVEKRTAP